MTVHTITATTHSDPDRDPLTSFPGSEKTPKKDPTPFKNPPGDGVIITAPLSTKNHFDPGVCCSLEEVGITEGPEEVQEEEKEGEGQEKKEGGGQQHWILYLNRKVRGHFMGIFTAKHFCCWCLKPADEAKPFW